MMTSFNSEPLEHTNSQGAVDLGGEVLILTGTPGSGKTTTAQALANLSGSPKVHLHSDAFWHFIKYGKIAPYLPEAHEQNSVVMEVLASVADGYARAGYFVVVDGIIGPWFLEHFKTLTRPLHYIVLQPPLDAAISRCRARGGETLTDPEVITALHHQLSSLGILEQHALKIAGKSCEETLHAVVTALQSGAYRLTL